MQTQNKPWTHCKFIFLKTLKMNNNKFQWKEMNLERSLSEKFYY